MTPGNRPRVQTPRHVTRSLTTEEERSRGQQKENITQRFRNKQTNTLHDCSCKLLPGRAITTHSHTAQYWVLHCYVLWQDPHCPISTLYLGFAVQGPGACVDLADWISVGRPHGSKNLLEPSHQLWFLCQTHFFQLLRQHLRLHGDMGKKKTHQWWHNHAEQSNLQNEVTLWKTLTSRAKKAWTLLVLSRQSRQLVLMVPPWVLQRRVHKVKGHYRPSGLTLQRPWGCKWQYRQRNADLVIPFSPV